jgi:hypothetical protein
MKVNIEVEYLSGVAILIRTSKLNKIGLLDPDYFMYIEDIDFSFRVRKNGGRIFLVPSSRITHKAGRSAGGAISSFVTYHTFRNAIMFMKKNAKWYNWPTFLLYSSAIAIFRILQAVATDSGRAKSMIVGLMDGFFRT